MTITGIEDRGDLMKRIVVAVLVLMLTITPALGLEHLSKSDLKISVEGLKKSYSPGEKVVVCVTVEPKNDEAAKKMENREYDIFNYLSNPSTDVYIYVSGLTTPLEVSGREKVVIPDYYLNLPEDEVLEKIEINVTGYVPTNVSSKSGITEFTYLKIQPEDGDTITLNLTVLNPSKLSETLKDIENRVGNLEKEINELSKYTDVGSLKNFLNRIKTNLTLAESYYNDHEYEKAMTKISWLNSAVSELSKMVTKSWASYYLNEAKSVMDEIDELYVKAEGYIDVANSAGKAKEVLNYRVNLTLIKSTIEDLKNDLSSVEKLYDEGNYNETVQKAKDLLEREKLVKVKLGMIAEELEKLINAKPTPTKSPAGFKFKLDTKTLTYVGIGIAVVVGGGAVAVAVSKWRQKRKWDELK